MSAEEFKQYQKFLKLKGKKEPTQCKSKPVETEISTSNELVVPEKTKRKCTEKQRASLEKAREALARKTLAKKKK
jgi:S-ribosylhomocysteine lyase LuxS involved in autoinducer biosynthesis